MARVIRLISRMIATEWKNLGIELDIPYAEMRQIEENYPRNIMACIRDMLERWNSRSTKNTDEKIFQLKAALQCEQVGHCDVVFAIDKGW